MPDLSRPVPDLRAERALIDAGRRALEVETRALAALPARLGAAFARACLLCLDATTSPAAGRVVVSGLGKSGHVAHKIAATLASTGTSAFFLHAAEACHGDLGMVVRGDVLVALSHSGESAELLALLPYMARLSVPVIALTGNPSSTLAREATVHLDVGVAEEACPLNLAPTASTTAALAMGDALATALLEARGFTSEDFARSHPAGALGRKLLRVADVMRRGDALPRVGADVTLAEGLAEMTRGGLGLTAVTGAGQQLLGVFTDGDLRRVLNRGLDPAVTRIDAAMTRAPRTLRQEQLAAEAVNDMQVHAVTALLVVDADDRLVGALNIHDLLRADAV